MDLFLATKQGVMTAAQTKTGWEINKRSLTEHHVTSIIAREGTILAGTMDGIFASKDGGASWEATSDGLTLRHVRWLAYHPDISDFELAGTEPAGLFVSRNGGASWHGRPEVEILRDEHNWWLPYSPESGCVRGFAVHSNRLYAAVEVGGLLRSDDAGENWQLVKGSDGRPKFGRPDTNSIHPDVHSVAGHPSSPDLVFAPTGGGFYVSQDGGETWTCRYDNCYVRAVWVDPGDADHLILGPANSVSNKYGRIEQSKDGGQTWTQLTERQPRNMVERFFQADDLLFAVMSQGDLWVANLKSFSWRPILPEISGINAITTMGVSPQ